MARGVSQRCRWGREGGRRGRIGRGWVPVSFDLLSGVVRRFGGDIQARVERLISGGQVLRLLLIVGGQFLRVLLLRHRGVTSLSFVEVWKLFVGDLLFDSDASFDSLNFSVNVTAGGSGINFLAGNVLDLGQLAYDFKAGLAVVHGGIARDGRIARGGTGASKLASARF